MTPREEGFLLLGSCLGNPMRKPLTAPQMRMLAMRVKEMKKPEQDRQLRATDLVALGYGPEMANRIVSLLEETQLLQHYLRKGHQEECVPLTFGSKDYPVLLRQRMGWDCPCVLWAKGNLSILEKPAIALVGSRDIAKPNAVFARQVGQKAAQKGYVLISGNARGADSIAQKACLEAGGQVISIVADELTKQETCANILYLSEDGFDLPFTSIRALSRNRVIHALGKSTFVAQCALGKGGTWNGVVRNLKEHWSEIFCFQDGSDAVTQLVQMGARSIDLFSLKNLNSLEEKRITLFDEL